MFLVGFETNGYFILKQQFEPETLISYLKPTLNSKVFLIKRSLNISKFSRITNEYLSAAQNARM